MKFSSLPLVLLALLTRAFAAEPITIERPWARASAPGQMIGGGFMTIVHQGNDEDHLVSAKTPIAREVQIHSMTIDGNVMRMRALEGGLVIPPGGRVTLQPGGLHLMFIDLGAPLIAGTSFPVTLRFAKAGDMKVNFNVEARPR
ncbi:MAG: copper chaperone PCu(A)C [Gammaproteobacteria bacterium]|nr:copper chaperone PCu(A)C [Gammaproteobacteria bacterium]